MQHGIFNRILPVTQHRLGWSLRFRIGGRNLARIEFKINIVLVEVTERRRINFNPAVVGYRQISDFKLYSSLVVIRIRIGNSSLRHEPVRCSQLQTGNLGALFNRNGNIVFTVLHFQCGRLNHISFHYGVLCGAVLQDGIRELIHPVFICSTGAFRVCPAQRLEHRTDQQDKCHDS
ncbi:hypothetical protein D3C73_880090 [compost metagenome]